MKKHLLLAAITLAAVALPAQDNLTLWYEQPAAQWVEALPVGNGYIGAMIFGGVEEELVQLNEGTLWSGGPQKGNINSESPKYLKPLREALAREDYETAHQLCRKMQGYFTESYMPMADLRIRQSFGERVNLRDYRRSLSLNDALATTRFETGGVTYTREMFTSAPDSIMVILLTASKPAKLTLDLSLASLLQNTVAATGNNQLAINGKAPARVDPNYYNKDGRQPIIQQDESGCNGMRFQTLLKAIPSGGTIRTDTEGIHIKDADRVLVFLSAATSFNGPDKCPDKEGKDEKVLAQRRMDSASSKSFEVLKQNHIRDFRSFFDRVSLTLESAKMPNPVNNELPSDLRLKLYSYGNDDPGLETLYFQYGRYLLISASRPGGSAANLQGLWNKELRPPWSSNYTININTEMNYWPAETANLAEMHRPLLDWIKGLSKTGSITAKEFYNARGWVAHHNSDIWGLSNPVGNMGEGDPVWANWYMGGAWLCQHLWERYSFSGDKEFLRKEAYPVMKEAALFCLDWLVEKDGYLVTSPSTSPENTFRLDGKHYSVSEAATMDMAIIHDLFTNLIEASEALGTDTKFRRTLVEKRSKLLPYQTGSRGQLQEWSKDYVESDPHHRHISHLFGLHPGRQISPLITPELAKAAAKTLELRGDEGTGWSKGWKINFAARLLNGDHAYKMIREIMRYVGHTASGQTGGTYPNFFDAHPPFQIDGNFGATAGFIEMLLQSHLKEIHLLPALPNAWTSGKVTGLMARGNFEVGIVWDKGALKEARVQSNAGGECTIRTSVPVEVAGVTFEQKRDGGYYLTRFGTEKGKVYHILAPRYTPSEDAVLP